MMIAHLFLVSVQQALKEEAPALTVRQAHFLLQAVLQALRQIQRSNDAAYMSHRKRILRKLNET